MSITSHGHELKIGDDLYNCITPIRWRVRAFRWFYSRLKWRWLRKHCSIFVVTKITGNTCDAEVAK